MRRALWIAAALLVAGCQKTPTDLMRAAKNAAYEKKPQDALRLYREALDIIERDSSKEAAVLKARALRGAADTYFYELGDVKQAVAVYRELIAQCPESPETLEARVILAELLQIHFHDLRGAITELTAALARNPPESAELHYKVAKLYFQLQDYAQCELEAQRIADRYETSAFADDALMLRAQALGMMEGRRVDATRAYEAVVAHFPESELVPHALFEIGKIRAGDGEAEKAIEIWVEALQHHPQPELVQAAIGRVRNRLAHTTPGAVGDEASAFDRQYAAPQVARHATSEAALAAPSVDVRPAKGARTASPAPASAPAPESAGESHGE